MAEVAEALGISRATAYRLIETGALPHIRVSNAIRVHPSDLERFAAARTAGPGNGTEGPDESP